MKDPIKVQGGGPEQYLGCTGSPADSHHIKWLTVR
jgi:cytochrome c oxidase subunit 5b